MAAPTVLAVITATNFWPAAVPAGLLLMVYLPGRALLHLVGLNRRECASGFRAAGGAMLGTALALALMPVLLNPIWHVTNQPVALLIAAWAVAVGLNIAAQSVASRRAATVGAGDLTPSGATSVPHVMEWRATGWKLLALAAFVTFAVVGPYWPRASGGAPTPSLIHDFIKHHAVLMSLERQPLPLGNVFYAAGAAGPAYYYHFFYLIPATLRAWSGVSIECAFALGATLTALGTLSLFYLLARRLCGRDGPALLVAGLVALCGGLDLIPVLLSGQMLITFDAWADGLWRIHPWITQMTWSPQNVHGVLVALLAAYVLGARGWWRGWFVLGPLLGAALIGSSVWIAFGVLPAVGMWVLIELLRARGDGRLFLRRGFAAIGVAGLMLLIAFPSLSGYAEMSRRLGQGLLVDWPHSPNAWLGRLVPAGPLANALDAPWFWVIELGPLLVLPLLAPRRAWQRAWDDAGQRLLLLAGMFSWLAWLTLRSAFTYNDFGQKISMLPMCAGALLAAGWLERSAATQGANRPRRWATWLRGGLALAVIGLGLLHGIFQASLTSVRRFLPREGLLARLIHADTRRADAERGVNGYLRDHLPADAVLQADWGEERLLLPQISQRPVGVTILERDTMVFQPADLAAHQACLAEVSDVLAHCADATTTAAVLRRYRITHVLVGGVERQRWGATDQFDDLRVFEPVYRDEGAAVYRLR